MTSRFVIVYVSSNQRAPHAPEREWRALIGRDDTFDLDSEEEVTVL